MASYALPASAALFRSGNVADISKGEWVDGDAYVAGGNIISSADLPGDLVAAGGNMYITGKVGQNLTAAGGTISLMSAVGERARLAGGNITIGGDVGRDLLVAGGMVHILPGATIKGDLYAGAGVVVVDGNVLGNVRATGGTVILNGSVSGTVDVQADERVVFGKLAAFARQVTYASPQEADAAGAMFQGGVNYRKIEAKAMRSASWWTRPDKGKVLGAMAVMFLIRFAAMLLAVLLGLRYFRKQLEAVSESAVTQFGSRLGMGFLVLVIGPILTIALFITIVGSVLGFLTLAVYGLLVLLAKVAAGAVMGAFLWRWFAKQKKVALNWKAVTVGTLIIQLIWLIPILGWLAGALVFLATLGAVAKLKKKEIGL